MTELTYTTVDKSDWGPGAWQDEPDKVQFVDEATGLPCLAKRHPYNGQWCGYVGVPPEHPAHGVDYSEIYDLDDDLAVHGGLTYAAGCQHGDEATSICHIPAPGEPDDVWWFGFDCAHGWDRLPGLEARSPELKEIWNRQGDTTYKPLGYVRDECAKLAAQLAALA